MGLTAQVKNFFKNWSSNKSIVSRAKSDSVKQEDYKMDELMLLSYYRSDPVIKRGINTIINKMFSDGYTIVAEEGADTQEEEAHEFIKQADYMIKLKNDTRMALIGGNGYHEVNAEAKRVFSLNPYEIEIELNKQTGDAKEYQQKINGQIVAKIDPANVIHLTVEQLGDSIYGIGLVESILFSSAIKRFAERNLGKRFEREKLRGFWLFKGMSDDDFDEMTKVISECKDDPQRDIYLKGGEMADVTYSDLIKGDDMQFDNLLKYLRQNQIIGLMLHPINEGIPEGSNKSSAGEENKDLDEAIASFQEVIQNIVTKRLFNDILGLDKIKFELVSVNKRDTQREVDIAMKLNTLPTSVNEVRDELGYPLIEEDWADEIRKTVAPIVEEETDEEKEEETSEEETEEDEDEEENPQNKTKSIQKKKIENHPRESPVKQRDEKAFNSILQGWIKDVEKNTVEGLKELTFQKQQHFVKQIRDPEEFIKKILGKNTPDNIRQSIEDKVAEMFSRGHKKAENDTRKRINLNADKLNFLKKYTFDLITGINDDMKNKLRQTLRRAILAGEPINQIARGVKEVLQVDKNRAEAIARTEVNRIANTGRMEAYKQAGVKKVKWIASIDDRTSEYCQELNGQVIDLSKGETFKALDFQGEEPPAHINCRSSVVFVE